MARARIEYQFGQLVEIEEQGSEQVENIKEKFKEYGINLPLLAGKIILYHIWISYNSYDKHMCRIIPSKSKITIP